MIAEEDFENWKGLDSTKEVFKILMDWRSQMMEAWANGNYSNEKNIEAVCKCQAFEELVNLDYETILITRKSGAANEN